MILTNEINQAAERFRRPSSLAAIALCEGRPVMEAAVFALDGDPASSDVADMGHDGHERIAACVTAWKSSGAWEPCITLACSKASADGVDSWTVGVLQFCMEFARDLIARHGIQREHVLVEQALDMESLGFHRHGTADLVLVVPGKLVIVVDWKLGYIDQGEADEHDQTQAYAAAAAETYSAAEVLVYLCQPRAPKEHRVTGARYDADALRANRAWTSAVLRLSRSNNPQLCAGYHQCLHCRALPRCPEANRFIMETQEALAALGEPLDADGMGELAAAAKLAEKFAEVGKDLAKAALQAGKPVTGWKLGAPRAIRSVVNPAEAMAKMEEAGIRAPALAAMDAITFRVAKLPPEAAALVTISEKLSDPPLSPDKKARAA